MEPHVPEVSSGQLIDRAGVVDHVRKPGRTVCDRCIFEHLTAMPIHTAFITNVSPAPANSGTPIRAVRLASALRSLGPVSL